MPAFVVSRTVSLAAEDCWRRVTDWPRHGDRVPLTRVSVATGAGDAVGDVVLARTSVGRRGFDDPMEIVLLTPPGPGRDGVCRLEKRGRTVHGWAELRVHQDPGHGTAVTWTEELRVRGMPRAADAITARVAAVVFGRVLDGLLRDDGRPGSAGRLRDAR